MITCRNNPMKHIPDENSDIRRFGIYLQLGDHKSFITAMASDSLPCIPRPRSTWVTIPAHPCRNFERLLQCLHCSHCRDQLKKLRGKARGSICGCPNISQIQRKKTSKDRHLGLAPFSSQVAPSHNSRARRESAVPPQAQA